MPDVSSCISIQHLKLKVSLFAECPTSDRANELERVLSCSNPAHLEFLGIFADAIRFIEYGHDDYAFASRCAKEVAKGQPGLLAWYYRNGLGVPHNPQEAFNLYASSTRIEDNLSAVQMVLKDEVNVSSDDAIQSLLPHLKNNVSARALYARILEKYKFLPLAIEQAEIAYQGDPQNPEVLKFLGLAQFRGTYREAILSNPTSRFSKKLALDINKARKSLEQIIDYDSEAAVILGQAYVKCGNIDSAIDNFRRAKLLGESQADLELGKLYFHPQVQKSTPECRLISENYGRDEAEFALHAARSKNYLEASCLLGIMAGEKGFVNEQLNYFQEAAFVGISRAQFLYATLLADMGSYDRRAIIEATAWLRIAIASGGSHARSSLDEVTNQLGEHEYRAVPRIVGELEQRIASAIKSRKRFNYFY